MDLPIALENALTRALQRSARRRGRRRARRRALRRFARLHPYWAERRFDEAFLTRLPDEMLGTGEAEPLAREWSRQFRYRDVRRRERDLRRLVPVAECFLTLLRDAEREERRSRRASRRADPWGEEIAPATR